MSDYSKEGARGTSPENDKPRSPQNKGESLFTRRRILQALGYGAAFAAGGGLGRLESALPKDDIEEPLLPNPDNITFTTLAGCDPEKDISDPRLYWEIPALLKEISKTTKIEVSCITTGHDRCANDRTDCTPAQESAHWHWRAFDITKVNGVEVSPDNKEARELVEVLLGVEGPLRPQKIGSPWDYYGTKLDPEGDRTFKEARLRHLHVQYKKDPDRS